MELFLRSPNWIGDCVMSLPAVRAVKFASPKLQIVLITKKHLSSVYKNISEIDEIIILSDGKWLSNFFRTVSLLKKYKIRRAVLLTNSFQSALVLRLAGVKELTGYSRDMRGWLLKNKKKFTGKSVHQIQSYLDLINLYFKREIKGSFKNTLIVDENEYGKAWDILKSYGIETGEKLIGISPVAAYGSAKEWGTGSYINLMNGILKKEKNVNFIIFGSAKDEEKLRKINESIKKKAVVISGNYTLREAIAIISICDIFIGNDSGLLHVADGLEIPAIGLFGPTSPNTTSPRGENTQSIYKSVSCSPCSYRECPTDHKCMTNIKVEEIQKKIESLLPTRELQP